MTILPLLIVMKGIFLSNPGKTYLGLGRMPSHKPFSRKQRRMVDILIGSQSRPPLRRKKQGPVYFFQKDHMTT